MPDMITIAFVFMTVLGFLVAMTTIGWLFILSKRLSALRSKVPEPESIQRMIQAVDRMKFLAARVTESENKADEYQNRLVELHTRDSEITARLRTAKQVIKENVAGFDEVSEKLSSLELRFDGIETGIRERLDQLPKNGTELNELASKFRTVEETVARNVASLAEVTEANRGLEALEDKIRNLRKFQIVTQRAHALILAAFAETRANMLPRDGLETTPEATEPEAILLRPREGTEVQETPETGPLSTIPIPSPADTGSEEADSGDDESW
jgi:hypothetical protein